MSLNKIIQKSIQNSRVRNILDNSDFTNPVNQRWQRTYSKDSGYTIDRWMLYQNGDGTIAIKDGFISLSRPVYAAQLYQKVPGLVSGRKYTMAAMVRGHGSINWRDVSNDIKATAVVNSENWTIIAASFIFESVISNQFGYPVFGITSEYNKQIDIRWAALYEGEYNVETLPDYWPKGYAAEELECKKYFGRVDSWSSVPGVISWENKLTLTIPYPVRMRVNPTATIAKGPIIVDGEYININETPSRVISYYGYLNVYFDTAIAGNHKSRPVIFVPSDIALEFNADL